MASAVSDMEVDDPVKAGPARPSNSSHALDKPRASSEPSKPLDYTVGYVYASEMCAHFCANEHPEQPERIIRIFENLSANGLSQRMKWIPIRRVRKYEALLAHSEDHWDKVMAIQKMTTQEIIDSEDYYGQLSLYVGSGTTESALLSCGGTIEACLAVARSELKKTFAIVRPPGHHAEPDEHMGFCFFNNVAVAARVVQQMTPLKKILILDWDVHHGNGTQRAFNDDPSVLYISIHRYEGGTFYPCGPFGGMQSCGEGAGLGYSVNIPWPSEGMGDPEYIYAFQKVVMPIAMEFAPDLVIISAGFDAAEGDDLGGCFVSPAGYAHMTHMLSGLAGGRLVVALEGGYNLDSISNSALAVTRVLLGEAPDILPPMIANEAATETIWLVAREQSKYWKSVDPKACEPRDGTEEFSFSIPEILKNHRQYYLATEHEMMQIPLMNAEMETRYNAQVMSTSDIFSNDTLVFFVHEFGNLRFQLQSYATCDAEVERSYLLDSTKALIEWVRRAGYALIDANLYSKPVQSLTRSKPVDDNGKGLALYLWDNYVSLSGASNVILIGHGPSVVATMELLMKRTTSVMRCVKAMINVIGHTTEPIIPKSDEITTWFRQNTLLVLPSTHRWWSPEIRPKHFRKVPNTITPDENQPIKLFATALPAMDEFVKERLQS